MKYKITLRCPTKIEFPVIDRDSKEDAVQEASWMLATDKSIQEEHEEPLWEVEEVKEEETDEQTKGAFDEKKQIE